MKYSLIIRTLNVVKDIRPSSDGAVADAIHNTLHYALDGRQEDWQSRDDEPSGPTDDCNGLQVNTGVLSLDSQEAAMNSGSSVGHRIKPGFFPNPITTQQAQRPYVSYALDQDSHTVSLPHPAAIPDPLRSDPCGPENREAHDVSAKFYFRRGWQEEQAIAPDEEINEALQRLRTSTGLVTLDTLVLSFEGIDQRWRHLGSTTEGLSSEEHRKFDRDVAAVRRVWNVSEVTTFGDREKLG